MTDKQHEFIKALAHESPQRPGREQALRQSILEYRNEGYPGDLGSDVMARVKAGNRSKNSSRKPRHQTPHRARKLLWALAASLLLVVSLAVLDTMDQGRRHLVLNPGLSGVSSQVSAARRSLAAVPGLSLTGSVPMRPPKLPSWHSIQQPLSHMQQGV